MTRDDDRDDDRGNAPTDDDTAPAPASGKTAGLARLSAAGIAVPPWRVLDSDVLVAMMPADLLAVRPVGPPTDGDLEQLDRWRRGIGDTPLPTAVADRLARARAELAAPALMVRSAAAVEDGADSAAAGLFDSVGPVFGDPGDPAAPADRADLDALGDAVRAVLASQATPAVWAHLAGRGLGFADVGMAIAVQRFIPGRRATGYTRAPDDPHAMLLELDDGRWARVERRTGCVHSPDADAPWQRLADLGAACEGALGGGPVDFEAVIEAREIRETLETRAGEPRDDERLWAVQARPIPPVRGRPGPPAEALAFSRSSPTVEWTWDAHHNPDPLSTAQIGLVEGVEAATIAPFSLRVVEGYLYTAPRHPVTTAPLGGARYVYETAALPAVRAAEAAAATDASLRVALAQFIAVYDVWANQLAPAVAESRRELPRWLGEVAPDVDAPAVVASLVSGPSDARLETLAARVAAGTLPLADLVERVGAMAAAWDVRCPTLAETPDALDRLVAGARLPERRAAEAARETLRRAVPAWRHDELEDLMTRAREAADAAELDDRVFARAQWLVRRSLLGLATRLAVAPDDIFLLPLVDLLSAEGRGSVDRGWVDETAAAARERLERQRSLAMPAAIRDGAGRAPASGAGRRRWRGRGSGGTATGPAAVVTAGGAPAAHGSIAVCAAVTPAMLAQVGGAAGLVCERGGVLDHGAAMARALGIPIVVGCADATRDVRTGDPLWMDGKRGVVCAL